MSIKTATIKHTAPQVNHFELLHDAFVFDGMSKDGANNRKYNLMWLERLEKAATNPAALEAYKMLIPFHSLLSALRNDSSSDASLTLDFFEGSARDMALHVNRLLFLQTTENVPIKR